VRRIQNLVGRLVRSPVGTAESDRIYLLCEAALLHCARRIFRPGSNRSADAIIARPKTRPDALGPRPAQLATDKELSDFLKSVERRAFKRTVYAVRDDEAALDIVQDSMIRLAEKYADRTPAELPLLFQRIMSNATMDWFRRQRVRNAVVQNFSDFDSDGDGGDFDLLETLETVEGSMGSESAADSVGRAQILLLIEEQVRQLPQRQREAFLLRYWEELDVAETAVAMGCSEGSVKTHCSRAVHALSKALRAKGITL
jgi:RNA polymerase sigma-70 factor, ECF subfamily